MSNSVRFKTNYNNTDKTRIYTINDVDDSIVNNPSGLKNKVVAINASLAGGTASVLANTFVSDDYDSAENIGTLNKITDVQIRVIEEVQIPQE